MPHFTYDANDTASLHQGDVIRRTEEIEEVLKDVHPHYFNSKDYKYFIVISQSCDLVLRDGGDCNANYITIAAVRPLSLAINRYIEKIQYNDIEKKLGFCDESKWFKVEQFVERLLNNNEAEYFYLHQEPLKSFPDNCCAFLRLSVPLKASFHYKKLLDAKILQLTEPFQHKLGFLVGNCYSRVGTEDWVPKNANRDNFSKLIKALIKEHSNITWLNKEQHRFVIKNLEKKAIENIEIEDLQKEIESFIEERNAKLEKKIEGVASLISDILKKVQLEEELIDRIISRLKGKPEIKSLLK